MAKYNNAHDALNQIMVNQFDEQPAVEPLYMKFGQATLPNNIDLDSMFVDVDVLYSSGEVLAKDQFNSLGGISTISKSGRVKAKLFDAPFVITKMEAKAILNNPSGQAAIRYSRMLSDAMGALDRKLTAWITAGGTIATDRDYDPDWHAPLAARDTTSETINDPQDMSTSAGTDTDSSAVNFTGAGVTVMNVASTFSLDKNLFANKIDTLSDKMLVRGDGTDVFTVFAHPGFIDILKSYNELLAASTYSTKTYAEHLAAQNIELFPSPRFSWTGAVDATTVYAMVPNIKENIFIAFLPGGQPQADEIQDMGDYFQGRVWCKAVSFAKPHTFDGGSTIEKAVARRSVTPIGA